MTQADSLLCWHFLRDDGCLNYPPHTKVKPGQTLTLPASTRPVLCRVGFHGSVRALDALGYAPGAIACRVTLGGILVRDTDKCVASTRTCAAMVDATSVLHEFACWCAEQALLLMRAGGDEPDARSWNAIVVKRAWLCGQASDSELAAARAAAGDAAWAWDAAGAAAWAARAAARAAAGAAAWAAGAAAWAAGAAVRDARAAAGDAAWAARAAARAARDAARAARAAAGDAQNAHLESMLLAAQASPAREVAQ